MSAESNATPRLIPRDVLGDEIAEWETVITCAKLAYTGNLTEVKMIVYLYEARIADLTERLAMAIVDLRV